MKIIVIDDDKLVALSLKTILENTGSIEIAAMGHSGEEAIALYRRHKPDVMLMDIRMQGMTGLEAGEQILSKHPDAKILYLTTFNDDRKIDGLEHWIGLVDDVLRLLKAWIKSDKERRYRLLQQRAIRLAKLETEVQSLKSMPFGIVENNTNTARNQWLRSPNPGNANNPRIVNSSGAVNNNNANNSNAVAPDCMDSRTE